MAKKSFEERKKIIYDLVRDALYVPMKEKELAIFLQVEPEDRPQLKQALEELLKEHARLPSAGNIKHRKIRFWKDVL